MSRTNNSPGGITFRGGIGWSMLLLALLLTSCVTRGFKQAAAVDLELRFYRWDSVCIAKPNTRENGFIPVLDAAEVLPQIERLQPGRKLAVVVVGYSYDQQQVRDIGAQWYQRLAPAGFQRVVALRGSDKWPIAGLPIVYDSAISSGNDTRSLSSTHAAPSSAPGTNAADPSVASIW